MLKPLEQWICDSCGEVIDGAKQGYVERKKTEDDADLMYDFRIVHGAIYSPRHPHGNCLYSNSERGGDTALDTCVGGTGVIVLTSWIDPGEWHEKKHSGPSVKSLREWTTLFRRLHVPYFEEAHRYTDELEDERASGANEIYLYLPETLQRIIEQHEENNS